MDLLTNSAGRIPPFEETLVNKRTVAAFLGMTESGFTKMIHRGEGPPYLRIGRLIRFSPTAVKAWASAQIEVAETVTSKLKTPDDRLKRSPGRND